MGGEDLAAKIGPLCLRRVSHTKIVQNSGNRQRVLITWLWIEWNSNWLDHSYWSEWDSINSDGDSLLQPTNRH